MKTVTFSGGALKALRKHGNMAARLRTAIAEYAADPKAHANQVTLLVGSTRKRLRVGNYRVLFNETETEIAVTEIGPRGDVYD